MKPFFFAGPVDKEKHILVYARPSIARNCFSAVVRGLRVWSERHPEFAKWNVVLGRLDIGPRRSGTAAKCPPSGNWRWRIMPKSCGQALSEISLMSSPHPSYPPLEMAHFGLRTLTNGYFCKDLSSAHDNIISLPDIAPETIASALATECANFEADPTAGWRGQSHVPTYIESGAYPFSRPARGGHCGPTLIARL